MLGPTRNIPTIYVKFGPFRTFWDERPECTEEIRILLKLTDDEADAKIEQVKVKGILAT